MADVNGSMLGYSGDPRTYLYNGQWVDPRTVNSPTMGGVTYAGPADSNGYIAGQAPQNSTPMYMSGSPQQQQQQLQAAAPPAPAMPAYSPMAPSSPMTGQNPYLAGMGNTITNQVTDNLQQRILPSIQHGFRAAGGLGSSRQGVLEARAINDANQTITSGLTNLYGNQFNADRNYNLGLGSLELGNRNADLSQTKLGADIWNMGNQGIGQIGSGLTNLGNQQQQAPWTVIGNANQAYSPYTGMGTTTNNSTQGGGLSGLLGGLLGGANLANQWKLWGS